MRALRNIKVLHTEMIVSSKNYIANWIAPEMEKHAVPQCLAGIHGRSAYNSPRARLREINASRVS
jgi:hypothetical protein